MSDTLPEIRKFLEQTNLPFEVWPCDPELADTAIFCEHYGVALATSRRPIDAACVIIATVGILLLTPEIGHQLDLWGVLFALGAGLGWAGVILISRHLGKSLQGGVGAALGMAVCGLLLFSLAGIPALNELITDPATIIIVVGVALLSAAIPYLFEYLALKSMPTKQFGVLVALEPVVAAIVGAIALAQLMDFKTWLAVVLISSASFITSMVSVDAGKK